MIKHNNPSAKEQIDRKSVIMIFGLLLSTIIIPTIIQQLGIESKYFDINNLVLTLTASLFGFVFIILGKNDVNKYAIGVMNSVLAVFFPIITVLPLFLNPISHIGFFIVVYIFGMILWFFVICPYIIGKENSNDEIDNNKKKFAKSSAILILKYLILIFFGILAMYVTILYIQTLFRF